MVPDRKPGGHWGILFALGLVWAASLGQAQEQAQTPQETPATEQEPPQALPIPLPVDIVEDQAAADARERREAEAEQREIEDLIAQQGMNAGTQAINEATQRTADYAFWSTVFVGIGTILLIATLVLTLQANWAAQKAVTVRV